MEGMIDITGVDLRQFVKEVYNLSQVQGMGFLHSRSGELDEQTVDGIVNNGGSRVAVSMDYVHGRACKMVVFREGDKLYIRQDWYDHTPTQLRELLKRVGK